MFFIKKYVCVRRDQRKILPLTKIFPTLPLIPLQKKQGRKRPLDTPKRMIERREREGEREKEDRRRDIERNVRPL